MRSTASASYLSTLEAERTELRSQLESLFEKHAVIRLKMKETEERLQQLDEEIDRVDDEGTNEATVTDLTGQKKHSLTAFTHMSPEVKIEGKKNDCTHNITMKVSSMTPPEEFLTDPPEDDGEVITPPTKFQRVSTSPSFNHIQRTSSNLQQGHNKNSRDDHDTQRSNNLHDSIGLANFKNDSKKDGSRIDVNPFSDLWFLTDTDRLDSNGNDDCAPSQQKYVHSNTLERYLIQAKPRARSVEVFNPTNSQRALNNVTQNNQVKCINSQYSWTDRMMHHLRKTFHISNFRDHQQEIINSTLSGDDIFVVMRTGGGKSLTYQLPAVLEAESAARKVTIVISPLVSLIRDQEEQMNEMLPGSALSFTSGMAGGNAEHARRWSLVRNPNSGVALIFVTPEKVGKSGKLKAELEKLNNAGRLGRFVIDECHCACQWGHDFRPDYTKLGILKHHFPSVPVLAVTATASDRVREDCSQILRLKSNYRFYRSSANRSNLRYSVRCKQDSKDAVVKDMVDFIRDNHSKESGIIYTFSRKEADEVADQLCENGIIAQAYHSDIVDSDKDNIHRSWMKNDTQVVVATIAFGLGINKPNVRFVLHHSISKSLEAYYQESGRAGRDGEPANCVLYYSPKDVPKMLGMIHGESGEPMFWGMVRYGQAHGDDALCRHAILATLGEADCSSIGTSNLEDIRNRCATTIRRDVGTHCKTVTQLVKTLSDTNEDCTLNQIVTKWRSKAGDGKFRFLKANPPGNDLNKDECERIIVALLLEDVFHPKVIYTAYSTICYISPGPKACDMLSSPKPIVIVSFPNRSESSQRLPKKSPKAPLTKSNDGWISRNKPKLKGKTPKVSDSNIRIKPVKSSIKLVKASKTVIELDTSSSSEDEFDAARKYAAKKRPKR